MSIEDHKGQIIEESAASAKSSRGRWILTALILICLVSLLFSGWAAYQAYKPVREQAQAGTDLAQQVKEACKDPKLNTADLRELCEDANSVVENKPEAVQGPQGDPGVPGERGPAPSDAQVANAVALYCATRDNCTGPKGNNASAAQVAEAVASYCNSRGECRGPEGAAGSPGQDGAQGIQGEPGGQGPTGEQGVQGPGPTDDQVATAVANYCSTRDGCRGPKGDTGDPAPNVQLSADCEDNPLPITDVTVDSTGPNQFVIHCVKGNTLPPQGGNAR